MKPVHTCFAWLFLLSVPAFAGSDPEIIHHGSPIGGCREIASRLGGLASVQNPACMPGNRIVVNAMNGYNGSHSEMWLVDPSTRAAQKVQTVSSATSYTGHISRKGASGQRELVAQCPGDVLCVFDFQGHKCPIRGAEDGEEATFSPDGSHIIFDRGGKLCTVGVKSDIRGDDCAQGRVQCQSMGGQATQPDWSPLGDKIVFQMNRGGWHVYTMGVSGGVPDWRAQILPGQPDEGTDASFGPDGSIIYSSGPGILRVPPGGGPASALKGLPRGYNGANVLCGDYVYLEHTSNGDETPTSVWQCDARFER